MGSKKLALISMMSIIFASQSACTKKEPVVSNKSEVVESTSKSAGEVLNESKLNTIKGMYAHNFEHRIGNDSLYLYSTDRFKKVLDMQNQSSGESCGMNMDLLMLSQDPDYENTNYKYSIDSLGLVKVDLIDGQTVAFELKCEDGLCKVDDVVVDNNLVSKGIIADCEDIGEHYDAAEEAIIQAANAAPEVVEAEDSFPNITYKLHRRSSGNSDLIPDNGNVEIISLENNVQIKGITVNRGNCKATHLSGRTTLGYGQSVKYYVPPGCTPDKIFELEVHLADGRSMRTRTQ